MKLSKEQFEKDSEILGAIIAGAQTKPLAQDINGVERERSVCAVGAGNIGRKILNLGNIQAARKFAKANGVNLNYVCGVNDGFEESAVGRYAFRVPNEEYNQKSDDYLRGYAVGNAALVYSKQRK